MTFKALKAFKDHSPETAPAESRAALMATTAKFGFLPSAMARLAESPSAVAAFGKISSAWESTALTPAEREVVAMTASEKIGCEVCVAVHSAILDGNPDTRALTAPLREGTKLGDARLETLRQFVRAIIDARGAASDAELGAFLDAGYTHRHALDVVVGVATYTLTAYANRLTRAPVDPAFQR